MVLLIARLGPFGPIDDLSSRFVIWVHNLYHMCCKQVYILLENNLLLLLLFACVFILKYCLNRRKTVGKLNSPMLKYF